MTETLTTTITLKDLRVNHAVIGTVTDQPPVVLLHGWGAAIDLVWGLAQHLNRYGYCVYALDLPGFGASDDPPQAWTVFDYATFVLAYLDANDLDRVHLFGHSFGGRLGLILGADHSDRLHKLVLSDAAGIRTPAPLTARIRLRVYKSVRDNLYRIGAHGLADRLHNAYNARYGSDDFQQASGVMRETFVRVVNEDLLPYAERVAVSTLLFWGDQDEATPLWQGELLEARIPDAGLVTYEGAGHYAYLERPAETARVMDYFFKQS